MDSIIGAVSNFKVDTVLSAVDKYVPGAQNKIKNLADKAKAYVNNVTDLEMKVLEATNHEPWGPHGSAMQEITQHSFNSEGFYQIMGVVDQRLSEGAENWRLVYKTLLLLEYMCKHGPLAVVEALGSYSRLSLLEKLRDRFEFKDPAGRDQGINVRQRAGVLVTLVNDKDKLAEERDKAAKNKTKYTGVSSSSMSYGGFGGGGGSSGYSGGSSYSSSSQQYGSSSTSYNRSNSSTTYSAGGGGVTSSAAAAAGGSGGFGDRDLGAAGGAAAADPIEATRQRIDRLKAEGVLATDGSSGGADGVSTVGPGLEDPNSPRKPKKLSETKINPAISAMFAKGGLAPPPATGSRAGSAGGAAAGAGGGAVSSGIDLLGDLDVPAMPAAAPRSSAPAAGDEWDGFASAPPAAGAGGGGGGAAAGGDEWTAFDSAPVTNGQQKAGGGVAINALLGPLPTTGPAATKGKAPLPLDDFCSFAPAPAARASFASAAPAAAAADPFGAFVAPSSGPAAASNGFGSDPFAGAAFSNAATGPATGGAVGGGFSDPFAASGVVHMVPQAAKQHPATGPKLGPETAKAKDPFADLAFL